MSVTVAGTGCSFSQAAIIKNNNPTIDDGKGRNSFFIFMWSELKVDVRCIKSVILHIQKLHHLTRVIEKS